MDIEKAKNRCNELVKVEHANWIGISNQEAIEVLLNELEKKEKKEKIIYEMAEDIRRYEIDAGYEDTYKNKEEVIDYFTKKVTKKD